MRFEVTFAPNAEIDLDYFKPRDQRIIVDGIDKFLGIEANIESNRRKRLRPNLIAPWELRMGDLWVFYEVVGSVVRVTAIGQKFHNDLFVRGQRKDV